MFPGNSLVVEWSGLGTFTSVAQVQPPVGELSSYKLQGVVKKKKRKKGTTLDKKQIKVGKMWSNRARLYSRWDSEITRSTDE